MQFQPNSGWVWGTHVCSDKALPILSQSWHEINIFRCIIFYANLPLCCKIHLNLYALLYRFLRTLFLVESPNLVLAEGPWLFAGPTCTDEEADSRRRIQQWGFIKWWASANNFQCCLRALGLDSIAVSLFSNPQIPTTMRWASSSSSALIVKLQTLSSSKQHWKLLPARQHWLLSTWQSC